MVVLPQREIIKTVLEMSACRCCPVNLSAHKNALSPSFTLLQFTLDLLLMLHPTCLSSTASSTYVTLYHQSLHSSPVLCLNLTTASSYSPVSVTYFPLPYPFNLLKMPQMICNLPAVLTIFSSSQNLFTVMFLLIALHFKLLIAYKAC